MIAVVHMDSGNTGSIINCTKFLGIEAKVVRHPSELAAAQKIILPGVGSFDHAMSTLESTGLKEQIISLCTNRNMPILGICLGMQLLGQRSEEGSKEGLNLIAGESVRLRPTGPAKVPHIGWNLVESIVSNIYFEESHRSEFFYFCHSYHLNVANPDIAVLKSCYGGQSFVSGIQHENIFGLQFHPEKSHKSGMSLMQRFLTAR